MNPVHVTALMPVKYYHPRYLQESVASMIGQTDPAWRLLLVIEPQQYDAVGTALHRVASDRRIRLISNEGRKLAGAVNTGMQHARTDFVALLLADDLWCRRAVAVLGAHVDQHADVDFFHSSRQIIDDSGRAASRVYASRPIFTVDDFKTTSPVKHLLCWRRSTALAIGGLDESLNSVGPDDYDFPWTMAERGARFKAVPDCLYYYRDHRDAYRLTTHLPLSVHRRECLRILKKHGVGWRERRRYITRAQRSFLRQCLYRNALDRWIKERMGFDARRGWRQAYR